MKRYRVCLIVIAKYTVEVDAIDESGAENNALLDHSLNLSEFTEDDMEVESVEEIEVENEN